MTGPHPYRAPALAAAIGFCLLVGGCNQATPTTSAGPGPTSSPSLASGEPSTPASSPGPSGSGLPAGQTDTDRGRIWDELPVTFPIYPGAASADETQTGPVSATFAIEGREARTVAAWMRTELERAGYRTEALNGPLEDGSFVLESAGPAGCRIEVAVAPLGGLTTVTVRYGAACPSP